jgi:hypothetical protein
MSALRTVRGALQARKLTWVGIFYVDARTRAISSGASSSHVVTIAQHAHPTSTTGGERGWHDAGNR